MIFLRRRRNPVKISTTPENLATLFQQDKITPFERRLFSQVIRQAQKKENLARELLLEHKREEVTPIAVENQDAVLRGVGLRRSLTAFLIFGFPLVAVCLMAYHHGWLGLGVLVISCAGVLACKLWDGHQLGRMVLADVELRALRTVATADNTAREVFVRWKKNPLPFTQRDFQVVENWLSAHKEMHRWETVQGLLKESPDRKTRRIYGRG